MGNRIVKIDYKPFLDLAIRRADKKISREHFIADWRVAQRDQGIVIKDRRPKK